VLNSIHRKTALTSRRKVSTVTGCGLQDKTPSKARQIASQDRPTQGNDNMNTIDLRTLNTIVRCLISGGYESKDIERHHLRLLMQAVIV
jgi:hypothetical protein